MKPTCMADKTEPFEGKEHQLVAGQNLIEKLTADGHDPMECFEILVLAVRILHMTAPKVIRAALEEHLRKSMVEIYRAPPAPPRVKVPS